VFFKTPQNTPQGFLINHQKVQLTGLCPSCK
jgi:Fe2+ or Zn2+ uptake regulation protein